MGRARGFVARAALLCAVASALFVPSASAHGSHAREKKALADGAGRATCGFVADDPDADAFRAEERAESHEGRLERVRTLLGKEVPGFEAGEVSRRGASWRTDALSEDTAAYNGNFDGYASLEIPLWYWSICMDDWTDCSDEDSVAALIEVQNTVKFNGTGISFRLDNFTYVNSSIWNKAGCFDREAEMMEAITSRPGVPSTASALHVYGVDCFRYDLLGLSHMPGRTEDDFQQGVVQDYRTLPCGNISNYSIPCPEEKICGPDEPCEGATFTHEVGHYLGLDHTFHNGCGVVDGWPGDDVHDTPPVARGNFGCPVGYENGTWDPSLYDSCSETPNRYDMITNFMDYGDDHCLETFTPAQVARMYHTAVRFRPTLVAASVLKDGSEIAMSCLAGSYWSGSSCKACEAGTYQNEGGQSTCKTCDGCIGGVPETTTGNYRWSQCWAIEKYGCNGLTGGDDTYAPRPDTARGNGSSNASGAESDGMRVYDGKGFNEANFRRNGVGHVHGTPLEALVPALACAMLAGLG